MLARRGGDVTLASKLRSRATMLPLPARTVTALLIRRKPGPGAKTEIVPTLVYVEESGLTGVYTPMIVLEPGGRPTALTRTKPLGAKPWRVFALATGGFAPSPAVRARKEAISCRVTVSKGQN